MQATLIFNESAGALGNGNVTADELQDALRQAGFFPVYEATEQESDLDRILQKAQGLVVAAGGDGTVRAVSTRLVGRDIPLAVVPMGTANNVARTLGIEGTPLEIIERLKQPRLCHFDVGYIEAPWGNDYFLEGAGFGFFADVLHEYDPEKGKNILRGVQVLTSTLLNGRAYSNDLWVDGERLNGDYLLVELLNTKAVGPRIPLAPDATPDDGLLDLVCIHESDREGFLQYARSLLGEDLDQLETVSTRKVRELKFHWDGFPFHLDEEIRPGDKFSTEPPPGEVTVRILPAAVELWLPSSET